MKTKKRLGEAYLELRRRHPIERIRVTEVCRLAGSNRTTFYHYFEDIYALNNSVEDLILEECLADFPCRGMIYTDPIRFLNEFLNALHSRCEDLTYLADGRKKEQYHKLSRWLVELGKRDDQNKKEEFILTFVIGGISEVISANRLGDLAPKETIRSYLEQIIPPLLQTKL